MGDISEIKKRAELYSKEKVFSFIIELDPSGRKTYYNGYIVGVKTDMIILFDSKLQREIPILLDCIEAIEPSRNEEVKNGG